MEMENTRRSTAIDRSRQLSSLKKPRIDAETPILRAPNSTVRFRDERDDDSIRERERGGGGGGGGSSSSNLSSYQQQQELVSQYRTALSELTFNSKPIITNLTIIAGENLLAAKGIAAAICNNVLEVPSDQKLPSLYLLDSIVKNIGRDYIKHFAARLPEVFCRAYKQVNSTLHPSMRHLFSTWRGVFPSTPLQMIEKELGFSPVVKNSSGTGASRSESQPQRPATSIHVNPKYLEARQRLQQSARSKEVDSDSGDEIVPSIDNAERLDRTAMAGNKRQWTDLSSKIPNIQRPQRELSNDPIFEKKGFRDIKTNESSSVLSPSRHTDLGLGRATDRIKERDEVDKSYYRAGGTLSETVTNRGNGFDANHTQGTYRASGFAQTDCEQPIIHLNNLNKGIHPAPKNWKNSEEEEYMWDDMNSKLTGYGGSNRSVKGSWNIETADRSVNMQRGHLIPPETEQPVFHRDKFDTFPHLMAPGGEDRVPLFRDIDEHRLLPLRKPDADPRLKAASVHHASSLWPREQILSDASHNLTNSRNSGQPEGRVISLGSVSSASLISPFPRPGPPIHSRPSSLSPSEIVASGPTGILGQQRQQHMHPPSPPSDLPPSYVPTHLHQKLQNTVDHDRSQSLFSQMPLPGHLSTPPHAPAAIDSPYLAQNPSLQLIPPHSSQPLSLPFSQLRHPPPPFLSQTQRDLPLQPAPAHIQAEKSPDVSGQSNTAHLLAALMKSGILPSNPSSGLQNFNIQPPLPSGPPPIQALTSSGPLVTPSSLPIQTTQGTGAVLPPLPPGPPPPSSKKSSTTSLAPNSFSSLLSSLVAKGIISSPAPEMPAATSVQIPNKVMEPRTELSSSASLLVHSTSDISTIHSSLPKEPFVSEPSHATGVPLLTAPNTMKMELLIHSTSDTSTIHSSLPKQPFVSEPSHATGVPLLTAPSTTEMEELIGIDFKPEIVREVHSSVINSLFDDLKHQCGTCGLRFKFQEQLSSHSDLHVSEKSLPSSSDEVSRKWYSNSSNWLVRKMELSKLPVSSDSLDDVVPITEACEPMVPADYSQCICALCGEPFEDYYSHDRDEWMYKGTVFLNSSEGKGDVGSMDDVKLQNFIVHTKCKSNSADNKDVSEGDTVDRRDG